MRGRAFTRLLATPFRRLRTSVAGSVAINFGLTLPVLLLIVGAAVDYANLLKQKAALQQVADSAALASARELRLGNTNAQTITAAAQSVVSSSLTDQRSGDTNATTTVVNGGAAVQVALTQTVPSLMGLITSSTGSTVVKVTATAKMMGGAPICVISLDPSASHTLQLDKNARVNAVNCAIYSDSTSANSIQVKNSATVTAALICSAGGAVGNTTGLSPSPQTDCPQIPDPLLSRPQPSVGGCDQTNLVISSGSQSLNPGVYCGGLRVTGGANVLVNPGVFIIKDGELRVDGGSKLTGTNVGFFFTGSGAQLNFDSGLNTINLTAPVTGPLAGILFFEDRSAPTGQNHQILSDDARVLLGTIYLPRGNFYVASNSPVADQSAYTILVANTLQLSAGPTLVLNSNYGATDIPVPAGVGPGAVSLQN